MCSKICAVNGCEKQVVARGFCDTHYRRFKKHGDTSKNNRVKHGHYGTLTYMSWKSMLARCYYKKHKSFAHYGLRGVGVCNQWRDSFVQFLCDMGERPSSDYTLERIDVNGNYEPGNCAWATRTQQQNNRRNTFYVEKDGSLKPIADVAREVGVSAATIKYRIGRGEFGDNLLRPTNSKKEESEALNV